MTSSGLDLERLFMQFLVEVCGLSRQDSRLAIMLKLKRLIESKSLEDLKQEFRRYLRERGIDYPFLDLDFYRTVLAVSIEKIEKYLLEHG